MMKFHFLCMSYIEGVETINDVLPISFRAVIHHVLRLLGLMINKK